MLQCLLSFAICQQHLELTYQHKSWLAQHQIISSYSRPPTVSLIMFRSPKLRHQSLTGSPIKFVLVEHMLPPNLLLLLVSSFYSVASCRSSSQKIGYGMFVGRFITLIHVLHSHKKINLLLRQSAFRRLSFQNQIQQRVHKTSSRDVLVVIYKFVELKSASNASSMLLSSRSSTFAIDGRVLLRAKEYRGA